MSKKSNILPSMNIYKSFLFFLFFSVSLFAQPDKILPSNFLTGENQDYTAISFKKVIDAHIFSRKLVKQINDYNLKCKKDGEFVNKIEILHVGKKLPRKLVTIVNNLYINLNRNKEESEKIKIDLVLVNPEEQDLKTGKSINDFLGDIESNSLRLSSELNSNNLILKQDKTISSIDIRDSYSEVSSSWIKNIGSSIKNLFGIPDGLSFIAMKRVKRTMAIKKNEFALALVKTVILTATFYNVLGEKVVNGEINNLTAPLIISAIDLFVFSYWQRHRLSFLKQGVEPILKDFKDGVSYFKFSHNKVFHFVGAFALSALVRISMLGVSYFTIDGVRNFFHTPDFATIAFSFSVVLTGLWASTQSAFSKIIPEILVTQFKKNVLDKMKRRSFAEYIYTGTLFSVGLLSTFAVVVGALFNSSKIAKIALLSVGVMGAFVKLWEQIGGHDKMFKFKERMKKIISSIRRRNNMDDNGFTNGDRDFAELILLVPSDAGKRLDLPFLSAKQSLCSKMLGDVSSSLIINF